jgi:hypothetical protein
MHKQQLNVKLKHLEINKKEWEKQISSVESRNWRDRQNKGMHKQQLNAKLERKHKETNKKESEELISSLESRNWKDREMQLRKPELKRKSQMLASLL